MITTAAVNQDLIDQFVRRVEEHPHVESAYQRNSTRKVKVIVSRDDDGNVPRPWSDWDDFEHTRDGVKGDDYIIQKLSGGGSKPGDKWVRCIGISAYCEVCDDAPQEDDHGLCGGCKVHRGLLTGPAGEEALVQAVHNDDGRGTATDPGQLIEATADGDGVLRGDVEYNGEVREQCFNADAHKIVRWVSNAEGDL